MRYMGLVIMDPNQGPPPQALMDAMEVYVGKNAADGIYLDGGGLGQGENRIGYQVYNAAELKTMQEVITFIVFSVFSVFYLGQAITVNHVIGFSLICAGAFFVFRA